MHSLFSFITAFCGFSLLPKKLSAATSIGATDAASAALCPTVEQRKRQFIVDVCDGNNRQAERLIAEKAQLHPHAETAAVWSLVYLDMLELTAEERLAAYAAPLM